MDVFKKTPPSVEHAIAEMVIDKVYEIVGKIRDEVYSGKVSSGHTEQTKAKISASQKARWSARKERELIGNTG